MKQEELKKWVYYNPETGIFINLIPRGGLYKGQHLTGKEVAGYVCFKIDGKTYKAHRLAFLYMLGYIPEYVDHINSKRDDNRWCNLREASWEENQHNSKIRSDNKSGVKGVRWNNKSQKWQADVKHRNKLYYVGMFSSLEAARQAVQEKRKGLHKDYANNG